MARSIWRINKVTAECGISRSKVYELMKEGKFPRPVKIVGKINGWNSEQVERWIDERLEGCSL